MSTSCHRLTLSPKLLIFPHKSKISDVPAGYKGMLNTEMQICIVHISQKTLEFSTVLFRLAVDSTES